MVAKKDNSARLAIASQAEVFAVLVPTSGCAFRADNPCSIIEVELLHIGQINHLIDPSDFLAYDLLADAGSTRRLLRTDFPPLLRGVV